jgi:hypothetical protein
VTVIAVPFHVPAAIVPTLVNDEAVTAEASVDPVSDPAGAAIAVLQPNPVPLVHIKALAVVEQDGTVCPVGATAVNDPKTWLADRADSADSGIVVLAVIALVPFPYTYPVSVVAPVPPLGTGKTLLTCEPRLTVAVVQEIWVPLVAVQKSPVVSVPKPTTPVPPIPTQLVPLQ